MNGNEFVGTPEYMSPELINCVESDCNSDLWALGCIIYQMLSGENAFQGNSQYLTFQRVMKVHFHMPPYFSPNAADIITNLVRLEPASRIGAGGDFAALRTHAFFASLVAFHAGTGAGAGAADGESSHVIEGGEGGEGDGQKVEQEQDATGAAAAVDAAGGGDEGVRAANEAFQSMLIDVEVDKACPPDGPAHAYVVVPSLKELCVEYIGKCLASKSCEYGERIIGTRGWTTVSNLQWPLRALLARKVTITGGILPPTRRMLFPDKRSAMLCRAQDRQYLGLTKFDEGKWTGPFHFAQLWMPRAAGHDMSADACANLRETATRLNAMKPPPRFVVVGGVSSTSPSGVADGAQALSEALEELNPDISVIVVPGTTDVGDVPRDADIDAYGDTLGNDYYSFWSGGVLFMVLNTPLLCDGSRAPERHAAQKAWIESMLFFCRNCANQAVLLGFDPFLNPSRSPAAVDAAAPRGASEEICEWLREQMHVSNVRAAFGGAWGTNAREHHPRPDPENILHTSTEMASSAPFTPAKPKGAFVAAAAGSDSPAAGSTQKRGGGGGVRIARLFERHLDHSFYRVTNLPKRVELPDLTEIPTGKRFVTDDEVDDDEDEDEGEDGGGLGEGGEEKTTAQVADAGNASLRDDTVTRQLKLINEALGEETRASEVKSDNAD